MSEIPMSEANIKALGDFVEPFVCPIQAIPSGDTREPPGHHHGTGWLYRRNNAPTIVTCEHVARWQRTHALGYSCWGTEQGVGIEGRFSDLPHPIDAAIADISQSFLRIPHRGTCVEKELLDTEKLWVQGELFYAYGFPRTDSAQVYGTQIVKGNAIFLRVVELNPEVFNESPPHPDETSHICLNWNPEEAQALMKTTGALSLPDGMSGSPLWNTRYEEITSTGGTWKASDARVTGMIWGHSAKAGQVYATPIALLKPLLW